MNRQALIVSALTALGCASATQPAAKPTGNSAETRNDFPAEDPVLRAQKDKLVKLVTLDEEIATRIEDAGTGAKMVCIQQNEECIGELVEARSKKTAGPEFKKCNSLDQTEKIYCQDHQIVRGGNVEDLIEIYEISTECGKKILTCIQGGGKVEQSPLQKAYKKLRQDPEAKEIAKQLTRAKDTVNFYINTDPEAANPLACKSKPKQKTCDATAEAARKKFKQSLDRDDYMSAINKDLECASLLVGCYKAEIDKFGTNPTIQKIEEELIPILEEENRLALTLDLKIINKCTTDTLALRAEIKEKFRKYDENPNAKTREIFLQALLDGTKILVACFKRQTEI